LQSKDARQCDSMFISAESARKSNLETWGIDVASITIMYAC